MRGKVTLSRETNFYLENGLKLPNRMTPPTIAIRRFWDKIMERTFITRNLHPNHSCTSACGRVVRMLIGAEHKQEALKSRMPMDVIEFIDELEEMIEMVSVQAVGLVKIGAVGVLFTPCIKKMEILDSAVYLKNCNY